MKNTITYKTKIAESKPWQESEIKNFVQILKNNADSIYSGQFGIYLSRKVNFNNSERYFPFLDIDGHSDSDTDQKIENAISNCTLTLKALNSLGVLDRFFVVATGNSGFRVFSNMLLSLNHYKAFLEFVRAEMSQVLDLAPTIDITMPHQILAYKGHPDQNPKNFVGGHSEEISSAMFLNGNLDVARYRELTNGKPEPDTYVTFMEKFLQFEPVSDLSSLGEFGKRLEKYASIANKPFIKPFEYRRLRKNTKPISLEIMSEMLREKGLLNNICDASVGNGLTGRLVR